MGLLAAVPVPLHAQVLDEAQREQFLKGTVIAHDVAIPVGLLPFPKIQFVAEVTQAVANLALKLNAPLVAAPANFSVFPNTADQCGYRFVLPRARSEFSNVLGLADIRKPLSPGNSIWKAADDPANPGYDLGAIENCLATELAGLADEDVGELRLLLIRSRCNLPANNWGVLGPPNIRHYNADVDVTVSSSTAGIAPQTLPQIVEMPAGIHTIAWTGQSRLSPGSDVIVPSFVVVGAYTEMKNARAAKKTAQSVADGLDVSNIDGAIAVSDPLEWDLIRNAMRQGLEKLLQKAKKGGVKFIKKKTAETILDAMIQDVPTASRTELQFVGVYDVFPPSLGPAPDSPDPVPVEAMDFGGTRTSRVLAQLRSGLEVSDACGREPLLSHDAPEFLPLGPITVTWTATDLGPNPPGDDPADYVVSVAQQVVVADTQPPLLLAPASQVHETGAPSLTLTDEQLGFAAAVDLADAQPSVSEDAPDPLTFATNSRTPITWTATDASGNSAQQAQWITIKSTGSNTAPSASPAGAATLTSQPVDIVLTASDPDLLSGRHDALSFRISDWPDAGEFVAPLYPFFIDDLRTSPADSLGPAFAADPFTWMRDNRCDPGLTPEFDFVFQPSYVIVRDSGERYVLDHFFICEDRETATTRERISYWDANQNFLGHERLDIDELTNESFVLDRNDGGIYYITVLSPGSSSSELRLTRCRPGLVTGGPNCTQSLNFQTNGTPIDATRFAYARVDSAHGIAYITDRRDVFAYRYAFPNTTTFLGRLIQRDAAGNPLVDGSGNPIPVLANVNCALPGPQSNAGYGMEVDSQGNLYVADSCGDRIHKYAAPTIDESGGIVLGDHIGWAGGCSASTNNACDETLGRSRGFVCTDTTCTHLSGALPGQLSKPLFLAADPRDLLYAADYENFRVQRFTPEGAFAGEAVSAGTGINRGERPQFVIGNMDRPRSVSVNSSQFFVVDRDEQFLHIFETLPFKDVDDGSLTGTAHATLRYVSRFDFHGAADQFRYTVSDGLAQSEAAVSVQVDRNFRPPTALPAKWVGVEDTSLAIALEGDDPDGIVGEDVFGLDVLSFQITSFPEHGTLGGSGDARTYQPDPGFSGGDSLRFTVSDGVFTSDEAVVEIQIDPVNDPPDLTLTAPEAVAVGIPVSIRGIFIDDLSDSYTARVNWGDGTPEEGAGGFDPASGSFSGVALAAPMDGSSSGEASATHTYTSTGAKTITLCVSDAEPLESCDSVTIQVQELTSLGVAATSSTEQAVDSTPFEIAIDVAVDDPSAGSSLNDDAAAVSVRAEIPEELVPQGVTGPPGSSCNLSAQLLVCDLGTIAAGDQRSISLQLAARGDLIYDATAMILLESSTSTPAVTAPAYSLVDVPLVADATDSDGDGMPDRFENAYGLDPFGDDGAVDLDGDGLDNLGEFQAHSRPDLADTDLDGLGDGDEVQLYGTDPGEADSDGDGMPDGWEVNQGLDPQSQDGELDDDGDGLLNAEEYELRLDPHFADSFAVSYQHLGATDPKTEGWAESIAETSVVGPVEADYPSGLAAWATADLSSAIGSTALYTITPTAEEVDSARLEGWTLAARLRLPDSSEVPDGSPMLLFRDGSRSWQLHFGTEVDGDPIVVALTQVPQTGPRYVIEGGAGDYHLYELVYDPATNTADVRVDGEVVISGYAGFAFATRLIAWGHGSSADTGRANYNRVRFSTPPIGPPPIPGLPPRAAFLLAGLLLVALLGAARRARLTAGARGRDRRSWFRG